MYPKEKSPNENLYQNTRYTPGATPELVRVGSYPYMPATAKKPNDF